MTTRQQPVGRDLYPADPAGISSLTGDGVVDEILDLGLRFVDGGVEEVDVDPVEAPDARLRREVALLVVRRRRTEDDRMEASHQVFLDVVHQLTDLVRRNT